MRKQTQFLPDVFVYKEVFNTWIGLSAIKETAVG